MRKKIIWLFSILALCFFTVPTNAASKKTMHLVKTITNSDGTEDYKYTYTKTGLIKKETVGLTSSTITYKYKKGNVVSSVEKSNLTGSKIVRKNTFKNRKLIKRVMDYGGSKKTYRFYSDKKGRLVKEMEDNSLATVYQYDKKGRIKKSIIHFSDGSTNTTMYQYDKKGNTKKIMNYDAYKTIKNTYKNGRLVKRNVSFVDKEESYYSTKDTYTYTYVKVKVPVSKVKKIREQQSRLLLFSYTDWID